ncbi:MAG: DUF5615 family PIN-like protein [Solirubrobacteraceae bacterium]
MKLVLDEMYSQAIAEQLRARGHDVHAVVERTELRALADPDIFALAQAERRAVVTENIRDFIIIANSYDQRGQAHHGLVLVVPSSYPREDPRLIGRMVTALEKLLIEHPETTPMSSRHWL